MKSNTDASSTDSFRVLFNLALWANEPAFFALELWGCHPMVGGMNGSGSSMPQRMKSNWLLIALVAAISVVGVRLTVERYEQWRMRDEAWSRAQALIKSSQQSIDTKLDGIVKQQVQEFFFRAFAHADAFAGEVVSLKGKWQYAKSKMQSGDKEYAKWVEEELTHTLLDPNEMQDVIRNSAQQYLKEITAEESRLLVKLSQDVFAMPEFAPLHLISPEQVRSSFDGALAEVANALPKAIGRDVGTFVASDIATTVLAGVVTRLTVSGTIIGGGAAFSAETLGITLVAAVVVDYVVTKIWNMFSDPEKEIAETVKQQLYELRNQVLWGDANRDDDGLLFDLDQISKARARVRSSAIKNMIMNPKP